MPTLTITKSYSTGNVLTEAMLDDIRTSITTFVNSTKLDGDNLQTGGVPTAALASGAVTREKIVATERLPIGMVSPFAGTSAPSGWLLCDGSAVSRTTYADLFAVIAETHGEGDNATTFNLPDYRGRFIRGVDHAQARDPNAGTRTAMATGGNTGDNVGSLQTGDNLAHTHSFSATTSSDGAHTHTTAVALTIGVASGGDTTGVNTATTTSSSNGAHTHTVSGTSGSTGGETRPINAYVEFIIKF